MSRLLPLLLSSLSNFLHIFLSHSFRTHSRLPTTMTDTEIETTKGPAPAPKEKLQSVMEAASALTALADEESENGEDAPSSPKITPEESPDTTAEAESPKDENSKRFLPDHKKPDAALTFPEKLMNLMEFAVTQKEDFCVAWLPDGKSFIIRNPDEFTRQVVPKYFKATKFSSFTRKLYRWGFRQVNRGIGPDDPIIFGNEHFQRDSAEVMTKMRSITAAGTRKSEDGHGMFGGMKRSMEDGLDEGHQKRMLLDHLMNQQKANMMSQNQSLFGAMNTNGSMSLSNALRPSMGMGHMNQGSNHMMGMNGSSRNNMQPYDLMANHNNMSGGNGMNNFMPQGQGNNNGNAQYPNASSTAEIVNAAIAALRYA